MMGSSRVLKYVTRLFTTGDAALPAGGMADIPLQIAASLAEKSIRCNHKVLKVQEGEVILANGKGVKANHIIVAVSQPACAELLQIESSVESVGEACVYFSSPWRPSIPEPFLVLNGEGRDR